MGTIEVHESDFTGKRADEEALGKLIVHRHPGYADSHLPVVLDALPEEVEPLHQTPTVRLAWTPPGSSHSEDLHIPASEFSGGGEDQFDAAMRRAGATPRSTTSPPSTSASRLWAERNAADYTSLEYAGTPHIGRVSQAEQEVVRNNLAAVNEHLRTAGLREIDPDDSTLAKRYGLTSSAFDSDEPWPASD